MNSSSDVVIYNGHITTIGTLVSAKRLSAEADVSRVCYHEMVEHLVYNYKSAFYLRSTREIYYSVNEVPVRREGAHEAAIATQAVAAYFFRRSNETQTSPSCIGLTNGWQTKDCNQHVRRSPGPLTAPQSQLAKLCISLRDVVRPSTYWTGLDMHPLPGATEKVKSQLCTASATGRTTSCVFVLLHISCCPSVRLPIEPDWTGLSHTS